ncbi:hypothetical protein QA639_33730 [Bradyrhizobium pachyrhizi]|uniref:hypothetical protein n=1 Tax=Bradyrhizobium pachyrhizi TaxID=280333 RepID=UPI0024B27795|nr:hypothetical protein [Bradyrhizobium pachyrhizi]WFU54525.1 hypothetical protein QA639_33730 [Bradyrhizobium pachyrhizi]
MLTWSLLPTVDNPRLAFRLEAQAIRGPAILLGKRAEFGQRFPAKSTVETLEKLVRWLDPEPVPRALSGEMITAILIGRDNGRPRGR